MTLTGASSSSSSSSGWVRCVRPLRFEFTGDPCSAAPILLVVFRIISRSEARRFLCGAFGLKMAADGGALKDINEIKSQFRTREGFYKLLTLSDSQQRAGLPRGPSAGVTVGPGAATSSIPGGGAGVGLVQGPGSAAAANSSPGFLPPVRVSMVKLKPEDPSEDSERVCFNIGRELYFYTYTNIKKVRADSIS